METMEEMLQALKALGDESRLRIVWMLEERELCACEIQEGLGLAQSTVSRHLQVLEDAGVIVSRRAGPWKNFQLHPVPDPSVQGLLAAVRIAGAHNPKVRELRWRMQGIHREDLCKGGKAA
jgi:ArsR family transcriptional regulator